MKKYLTWAIAAFVVFYLISSPEGAAGVVRDAVATLAGAAESLSRFVNALQ